MVELNHYAVTRLARTKAQKGDGCQAPSEEEAITTLPREAIIEGALLELVLRLNQAINAWAPPKREDDGPYRPAMEALKRPANARAFPGVTSGDSLWYCPELAEGVYRVVVVAVDAEGYALVMDAEPDVDRAGRTYIHHALDWHCRTEAEAVRRRAEADLKWLEPQLRQAREVIEALDAGRPYGHLLVDPDDLYSGPESAGSQVEG